MTELEKPTEWDPDAKKRETDRSRFVTDPPRQNDQDAWLEAERVRLNNRLEFLRLNPFDPRTELSADAKHVAGRIVKHLWIIFVLLPIVAIFFFELAR